MISWLWLCRSILQTRARTHAHINAHGHTQTTFTTSSIPPSPAHTNTHGKHNRRTLAVCFPSNISGDGNRVGPADNGSVTAGLLSSPRRVLREYPGRNLRSRRARGGFPLPAISHSLPGSRERLWLHAGPISLTDILLPPASTSWTAAAPVDASLLRSTGRRCVVHGRGVANGLNVLLRV